MNELAYAHGGPALQGTLRAVPENFEVDEELGFEPDGKGEHVFVRVEKREENTEWVAQRIAQFARVAPMNVSYSGLKDRHALTRQTFSVQLPGKADPDWQSMSIEGVHVLSAQRHSRKLKRGVHRGNHFVIRLTDVSGDRDRAEQVIARVGEQGVPNYFGIQRFGRNGDNLRAAQALFAGARMARSQRGFALSAARSQVFNAVLNRRVADGTWNQPLEGDVWMLAGTHSIFGPQALDDTLRERLATFDIDPTGPLWGRGELRTTDRAASIEQEVGATESILTGGLVKQDLRQERRSLRLRVEDLQHEWESEQTLRLSFRLPSGAFATSVVREICRTDNELA
jgi:tRNA pseudouridine13 synthase